MSLSLPSPSSRLLRAAAAEQADLARHRERLVRERVRLVAELRGIDDALAAADKRLAAVAHFVDAPSASVNVAGPSNGGRPSVPETPEKTTGDDQRVRLRGPAIRETAVRVLIKQPEHVEALHYRRWYELLLDAGYDVAGKDPVAVFLTQVSRSPVVLKAAEPGLYEIDRQAPLRIRQRLERLQVELREVTLSPQGPFELASIRAHRHELDLSISQLERALEEALRVLHRDDPEAASAATATAR